MFMMYTRRSTAVLPVLLYQWLGAGAWGSPYRCSLTSTPQHRMGGCYRPERLVSGCPWSSPSGCDCCLHRRPWWECDQSREQSASFTRTACRVQHSLAFPTMTMDSSYVGRYGTLSLMKKDGSNIPVAHYPIDDEEVTIGRDPNCSVRLYYDTISKLHCKITFEDAKVRVRSMVPDCPAQTALGILDHLRNLWTCGGWFSPFPDRYRSDNRTTWQQYRDRGSSQTVHLHLSTQRPSNRDSSYARTRSKWQEEEDPADVHDRQRDGFYPKAQSRPSGKFTHSSESTQTKLL